MTVVQSPGATQLCTSTLTVVCTVLTGGGAGGSGILGGILGGLGLGVSNIIVYSATATCPTGQVAVGGGANTGALAGLLASSYPSTATGGVLAAGATPHSWTAIATGLATLTAYAVCAPGT